MSKPLSTNDQAVKDLADKLWNEMLASSPIWGTFLGIEVDDRRRDLRARRHRGPGEHHRPAQCRTRTDDRPRRRPPNPRGAR